MQLDAQGLVEKPGRGCEAHMTGNNLVDNSHKWLFMSIICIALLTCRWILVAGTGEYGMMYDQAYRLAIGQHWYRDLLSTHPPFAAHILGALFRLLSPSLLLYNVHLYLWWLASLVVGYLLLRRCVTSSTTQCAALLVSAALSLPCLSLGHAYFYTACVFGGLFVLCLDVSFGDRHRTLIFCAGLVAGITVFVRQNLGLVLIAGTVFLYLLLCAKGSITYRTALSNTALLGAGFGLSFLSLFLLFSRAADANEVFHELLLDGAHGKAGEFGLLVRLIPRINLKSTLHYRRVSEIIVSLLVYPALALWFAGRRSKPVVNRPLKTKNVSMSLVVGMLALVVANLLTLAPINNPPRWLDSSTWPYVPGACLIFIDLLNIAWLTAMAFRLPSLWVSATDQDLGRGVLACFLFVGTIVSNQSYSVQLAAVLVPLTIAVFGDHRHSAGIVWKLCLLTAVWSVLSIMSMPTSFHQLVAFPGSQAFATVRAPAEYVQMTTELSDNVTPLIEGRDVIWITMYGPHAAFGGIPASPNVVPWDKTTFTSRQLSYVLGRWRAKPPANVMLGSFWGRDDTEFGSESEFGRWLDATYQVRWCSKIQPDLCLWTRR